MGYKHPKFMFRELTSEEIAEWMAFYKLEPFGHKVEWMRAAMIAQVIANSNRGKRGKRFKLEDFMPDDPKPKQGPQTVAEQLEALKKIAKVVNKRELKLGNKRQKRGMRRWPQVDSET